MDMIDKVIEMLKKAKADILKPIPPKINTVESQKVDMKPKTPNEVEPIARPNSKKDPLKVAQQIKDKPEKNQAVIDAKQERLKFNKNGQWKLGK